MVQRAVVVCRQPLPEKELLLAKGLAGTQPHGSRPRRLAVLFEKRQLGRVAKPELGLAGLTAEGAHCLEPRTVSDDRLVAVWAFIAKTRVPQLIGNRHCSPRPRFLFFDRTPATCGQVAGDPATDDEGTDCSSAKP